MKTYEQFREETKEIAEGLAIPAMLAGIGGSVIDAGKEGLKAVGNVASNELKNFRNIMKRRHEPGGHKEGKKEKGLKAGN